MHVYTTSNHTYIDSSTYYSNCNSQLQTLRCKRCLHKQYLVKPQNHQEAITPDHMAIHLLFNSNYLPTVLFDELITVFSSSSCYHSARPPSS